MVNVVPRVLAAGPPEAQHSPWYLQGFFIKCHCISGLKIQLLDAT